MIDQIREAEAVLEPTIAQNAELEKELEKQIAKLAADEEVLRILETNAKAQDQIRAAQERKVGVRDIHVIIHGFDVGAASTDTARRTRRSRRQRRENQHVDILCTTRSNGIQHQPRPGTPRNHGPTTTTLAEHAEQFQYPG